MAYHPGVGVSSLATSAPTLLKTNYTVRFVGHICRYYQIKQMFEYLAILTQCQLLSEYCHGGKILLKFYYIIRSDIADGKGVGFVSENEIELIKLLRENDNPEKVAGYMLSLFLDYLRTHGPSQETPVAVPPESA